MLKVEGLTKRYATGDLALDGLSLTAEPGETLAIIGPSGAGKSTLIRCVNRLIEPTSGTVHIGDVDVTGLSGGQLRQLRRNVGMIFQEYALVERLTVMENVLSGRLGQVPYWRALFRRFGDEIVADAFGLLDRVGMAGMHNKRVDELSGGQRQRVGVARAMLQQPDLLLVDEPTASLDPKTSRQIMRLITDVAGERNLTVLINIHDVPLAQRFVDRIVGLRDGKVVYNGPPSGLDPDRLTEIYGEEDWSDGADDDTEPSPDPSEVSIGSQAEGQPA